MVPALHSEESTGQLRSKSGTGKHFVHISGNGAKRQLISGRVDVHYQGTGGYRSPRAGFCSIKLRCLRFIDADGTRWRRMGRGTNETAESGLLVKPFISNQLN